MGGHSDPAVTQPISADQALAAKLQQLSGSLQDQLARDFTQLMGVSVPSPASAALLVQDYDLVSTQTSVAAVVGSYETGAAMIVGRLPSPALQAASLLVVQSVLEFVASQNEIATGGYACSTITQLDNVDWICAVFCEVDFCLGQEWNSPVDFNIILFAFTVWSPAGATGSPVAAQMRIQPGNVMHWSRAVDAAGGPNSAHS